MYEIQHHFPFDVSPTRDGKVTLTLEIEAIHVKTFLQMLESLSSFFRVVNQKARVALLSSAMVIFQFERYLRQVNLPPLAPGLFASLSGYCAKDIFQ